MPLFRGQPKAPTLVRTCEQLSKIHRQVAENLLIRAAKAGRLEAETRWAAMAGAHASLALYYQREHDRGSTATFDAAKLTRIDATPDEAADDGDDDTVDVTNG